MSKRGRMWKLGESMNDVRQLEEGGLFSFEAFCDTLNPRVC